MLKNRETAGLRDCKIFKIYKEKKNTNNSCLGKGTISEDRNDRRVGRIRLEIGFAVTVAAIPIICKTEKKQKGSDIK